MTMNALGMWQKRNMVTVHTNTTAMLASLDCAADISLRLCAVALALCLSEGDRSTLLLLLAEVRVVSRSASGTVRTLDEAFLARLCLAAAASVVVAVLLWPSVPVFRRNSY